MIRFFDLQKDAKIALIEQCSDSTQFSPQIIEKDIWVCWALEQLFLLTDPLVFKGGTSLSKGYSLINRFSEDIDITIDYTKFSNEIPSKNRMKKISEDQLPEYILNNIIPYIMTRLRLLNLADRVTLEQDGEKLFLIYNSLFNANNSYLRDHVLIEFGAKNTIDPYEEITLATYLSGTAKTISLPSPRVKILHPKRTFWEKATLMHAECNRKIRKDKGARLSRHWYDMYMLSQSGIKALALQDIPLFHKVLNHKTLFFNNSSANYNNCKTGRFRLIPDEDDIQKLANDYNEMVKSGMFSGIPPKFIEIIKALQSLEIDLNTACKD